MSASRSRSAPRPGLRPLVEHPPVPSPKVLRSRRVVLGLVLSCLGLIAAGWATAEFALHFTTGRALTATDVDVAGYFADARHGWLTTFMVGVSWLASLQFVVALIAGMTVVARIRRRSWRVLWLPGIAVLGGLAISVAVKVLTARGRPPLTDAVVDAYGFAFPSGHSIRALVLYGAFAWLLSGTLARRASRVLAWAGAAAVILAVGFSRIYLGAHWVTDVLAGFVLGAMWLWLVIVITGARAAHRRPVPG